jgi:hypothetical protein
VSAKTAKRIPLDAAPRAEGTLVVLDADENGVWVVGPARKDDPPEFRYVSHFATCPDAAKWRR